MSTRKAHLIGERAFKCIQVVCSNGNKTSSSKTSKQNSWENSYSLNKIKQEKEEEQKVQSKNQS